MAKANDKIINKSVPEFSWTEVEAPGGIITKDGKRIDCTVVVPDGMFGYGDNQSLASMTGDTVDRVSTDSKAGEKAYETALEQADQDQIVRRRKVRNQMEGSKYPDVKMFYDPSTRMWDLRYMREDRETGLRSFHEKIMTDAEVGYLAERSLDRQRQKDE